MFKKNEIEILEQIQHEKQKFQKQLSLEDIQQNIIKDYKMKQGDYKIIITIYELNDLQPKSLKLGNILIDQKTTCDSFVQVKVNDQTKKTDIKKQTNNPIFDQQIFFQFQKLSVQQLDRSKILFNVYDTKLWGLSPSLIGCFQLDWTNVYFKRNHQIYRGWLTLYDPNHQLQGPVGYLLVNIAILGEKDQITVHDSAFIKDPLVTIQDTITSPKLPLIDFQISIQIYRAQNLVPIDNISSQVNAYAIAKFSGNKIKTSTIKSLNPEWNQCLKIGTQVPNKSKYITIQIRNKNLLKTDDLIGILKIPFIDICNQEQPIHRWGHLYGPPISGKDIIPFNYASKMQIYGDKIGSHYRGRVLFKISGKKDSFTINKINKLFFKFPYRIAPVVPLKLYTLRIDLIEGFGLPIIQDCYVQICIGQYTLKSKAHKMQKDLCEFFQMLDEKKINLSQDINSIPDLIIYFCNGISQENRIGYVRIKASELISLKGQTQSARTYQLIIDKSLNIIQKQGTCGFITAKIALFSSINTPPPRKSFLKKMKAKDDKYILKVLLYRGQNFPPVNKQGDCDPMLKFSFNGKHFVSKLIKQTYNPIWQQIYECQINLQNLFQVDLQKCLVCDVYDHDENDNKVKQNYIGSFSVKINGSMKKKLKLKENYQIQTIQMIYSKPRWYHIINPNIQIGSHNFGRVLLSCALFKKQYKIDNEILDFKDLQKYGSFNQINTVSQQKNISFYVIGIRQMKMENSDFFQRIKNSTKQISDVKITPKININCSLKDPIKSVFEDNSKSYRLNNGSCEMNKMYKFSNVKIPKNKKLTTYLDIKILNSQNKYIYGYNSINLRHFFDFENKQKNDQLQQKSNILDVEQLQRKLKKLKLLNNIKKNIQNQQSSAKFISNKRIQIANASQLIAPHQIDNKFKDNKDNDPEVVIQMDRILRQIRNQLEWQIETGNTNERKYIMQMLSSSSNNYIDPRKKQDHNTIDEQNSKLSLYKSYSLKKGNIIQQENQSQSFLIDNQSSKLVQNNIKQSKLMRKQSKIIKNKNQNFKKTLSLDVNDQMDQNISIKISKKQIQQKQRITLRKSLAKKKQIIKNSDQISDFDLDQTASLSENQYSQRAIKYQNVKMGLELQHQHREQAIKKQQQYKYAAAVKLSLFKWIRKEREVQQQTYQDYDTDQQQNLDIIPQWYKGRKILMNDLENYLVNDRKIQTISIYRGLKIDNLQTRVKQKIGNLKMVVVASNDKQVIDNTEKYYQKLLKPKQFYCRIYVLKGKSLLTNQQNKPSTYLRFTYGTKIVTYKDKLVKNEANPQYYMCHQQVISLPGPSTIKIQVMQINYLIGQIRNSLTNDIILGYTEIDIEDRYFIKKWHLFDKKPIQLRNLYSQSGIGTQGRIQTWIDLVQKKQWVASPILKISPPPWDQYQLRVIVWGTKDCVYKNQQIKSNDIFVRGQLGKSNYQQTDVHWACRSVSSFNYRFKFPIFYPPKPQDMYSDIFIVQIWDKDVIGYNNLIGQTKINLNKMHKLIQKAVKRKKPVVAYKKIIQKNLTTTDRFWFDVFNHKQKDQFGQLQSQGKVQLSFQLVPIQQAKGQRSNGYGRAQPNVYPTLPDPTGRLDFNILHPLDFVKQLLGPELYKSICLKFLFLLLLALIISLSVLFSTSIVAGLVAKN